MRARLTRPGLRSFLLGLSAVADVMFWPRKDVGWYLEPGFENDFVHGRSRRGFAMAAGLVIGR